MQSWIRPAPVESAQAPAVNEGSRPERTWFPPGETGEALFVLVARFEFRGTRDRTAGGREIEAALSYLRAHRSEALQAMPPALDLLPLSYAAERQWWMALAESWAMESAGPDSETDRAALETLLGAELCRPASAEILDAFPTARQTPLLALDGLVRLSRSGIQSGSDVDLHSWISRALKAHMDSDLREAIEARGSRQ